MIAAMAEARLATATAGDCRRLSKLSRQHGPVSGVRCDVLGGVRCDVLGGVRCDVLGGVRCDVLGGARSRLLLVFD